MFSVKWNKKNEIISNEVSLRGVEIKITKSRLIVCFFTRDTGCDLCIPFSDFVAGLAKMSMKCRVMACILKIRQKLWRRRCWPVTPTVSLVRSSSLQLLSTVSATHQDSCRDWASAAEGCHRLRNRSPVVLNVLVAWSRCSESPRGPEVAVKHVAPEKCFKVLLSPWEISVEED